MISLSVDVGTSAVKASLVDGAGRELSAAGAEYPHVRLPGEKVEIDPGTLLDAVRRAVLGLDDDLRRRVDEVVYDTFSPSLVVVRRSGELAYPRIVTHLDRRSRVESDDVIRRVGGERFLEITGFLPFVGGSGLLSLLWLRRHEPEAMAGAHRVGHLTTYLHHWLTGEWTTDLVNASMFGAYETVAQGGWSAEILDAFDLPRAWFPEVRLPGTELGGLRPEAARALGIPAGVPVAVGTNDMAAAQVGAGNDRPGSIMNAAGSSEMVSVLTDRPVTNPRYYLRCAASPGLWQIYATTAGGFALDWFHQQFARELDRDDFFGELVPRALAEHVGEGPVGFQPYLTGDRQSLDRRTASWTGLTLGTTREEMLAALVGATLGVLGTTIDLAREVVDLAPVIKVSGGLASDAYLAAKGAAIPGFRFEHVRNCSVHGNVRLARRHRDATTTEEAAS